MTGKIKIGLIAGALVICGLAGICSSARAQSQKQLDLDAERAQRKAIVGSNMNLTPEEESKFWPVYNQYEAAMDKIEDRHVREIKDFAKNYNNLTDETAKAKLDEVMAIAQARLDTQKRFIPKFRAVISGIKTTRFYQIDNKMHALMQCDIAQLVPLAHAPGEAGGSSKAPPQQ
ncbi:MAG TPA: hypothetical protein VMB26_11610 [Candidatus Binataceae bacterium]|nr:hypothetical protein [Candidatus Binataceae bacterium]